MFFKEVYNAESCKADMCSSKKYTMQRVVKPIGVLQRSIDCRELQSLYFEDVYRNVMVFGVQFMLYQNTHKKKPGSNNFH